MPFLRPRRRATRTPPAPLPVFRQTGPAACDRGLHTLPVLAPGGLAERLLFTGRPR